MFSFPHTVYIYSCLPPCNSQKANTPPNRGTGLMYNLSLLNHCQYWNQRLCRVNYLEPNIQPRVFSAPISKIVISTYRHDTSRHDMTRHDMIWHDLAWLWHNDDMTVSIPCQSSEKIFIHDLHPNRHTLNLLFFDIDRSWPFSVVQHSLVDFMSYTRSFYFLLKIKKHSAANWFKY